MGLIKRIGDNYFQILIILKSNRMPFYINQLYCFHKVLFYTYWSSNAKLQKHQYFVAHDFKLFIGLKFLEMISENANMVPASCYSPNFLLYPVLNEGLLLFTASNEIRHLLNISSKNKKSISWLKLSLLSK